MLFKILNLALVAIYAIGSGLWVNTGDSWYRNLNSPSWQPPDWVFGVIWPYNFIVLAYVGWLVSSKVWISIFALTIVLALTWAYQFYVPHNLYIASISLAGVAVLTIPLLVIGFRSVGITAALLIPYQIWVATAATLSYGYFKLNS